MHMPDPQKTGLVHIVGIGGIGMSAIAEVMHTRGYTVPGQRPQGQRQSRAPAPATSAA